MIIKGDKSLTKYYLIITGDWYMMYAYMYVELFISKKYQYTYLI